MLLLIVATLFYIQLEYYVVYTGQRNSGNNQINNRRKNNFYSNVGGSLGLCSLLNLIS